MKNLKLLRIFIQFILNIFQNFNLQLIEIVFKNEDLRVLYLITYITSVTQLIKLFFI